jgi:hypothetical protein
MYKKVYYIQYNTFIVTNSIINVQLGEKYVLRSFDALLRRP